MSQPIIAVRNLRKSFQVAKKTPGFAASVKSLFHPNKTEVVAVNDISFDIEQGELVGFLGPNGAGKTTTLKMLSGILHPSSGSATVLGYTPWNREAAYQRQFSLVMGQKNQLWWDLPALDSFELNKVIYQVPDSQYNEMVNQLGELLDVTSVLTTPVRKLSLGQRMKCELIAALLHRPRVLFLDEPTIGLDVLSQQSMREFVAEYNQKYETTILLTSHYMKDVERLCSRVIVIDHGSVIFDGKLATLMQSYGTHKTITLTSLEVIDRAAVSRYGELKEYQQHRVVIEVPKAEQQNAVAGLLQHVTIEDLSIDEVDMEEVIRDMFAKQNQKISS